MKKTQRLDKVLAHMGVGTRSEIRKLARQGHIAVNGVAVQDSGFQVNPEADVITVGGERVLYRRFVYLMMNKPQGVVSATEDNRDRTVLDLLAPDLRHYSPFPVGRLDKDTEGLLLLTNDGKLAHELLSPRKHVPKTYFAEVEGNVDESDVLAFARGVKLEDGYLTMPADLEVVKPGDQANGKLSEIRLTIMEGKFHQVKRMFQSVDKKVVYLKRLAMGSLQLDESLRPGQYRELSEEELKLLKDNQKQTR